MSFIALILGSVAIDKVNSDGSDSSKTKVEIEYCPYGDILLGDAVHSFEGHHFQVVVLARHLRLSTMATHPLGPLDPLD